MAIIALVLGMFSMDTQEFRETANKQMKEGYEWVYVGKTKTRRCSCSYYEIKW